MSKQSKDAKIDTSLPQGALAASVPAGISYLSIGKEAGAKVLNAESGAFKVTREIILGYARELGLGLGMSDGQLHVYARDFLDGYGQAFGEPSGKQRKKEVKAVFEASCIGEKTLYLSERQGDPNKLDATTGKPEDPKHTYKVAETKTGIKWLEGCASYARLYEVARMVKGSTSNTGSSPKVKTKLNDGLVGKMQENLKAASITQAAGVLQSAVETIFKSPDGERVLLNQMAGISLRLMASNDKGISMFAREIRNQVVAMVERVEQAKLAIQSSGLVSGVAPAPAPAVAPAPAEAVTDVGESNEPALATGTNG